MSGDLQLYKPGDEVSVHLVVNAADEYPERGEAVQLNGDESAAHPYAEAYDDGSFLGTVVDLPPEFDDDGDMSDGDSVGDVTVMVGNPVYWYESDDAALEPDDKVVMTGDGVVAYNDETHDADEVVGFVFMTGSNVEGTDGKVAVVRTA